MVLNSSDVMLLCVPLVEANKTCQHGQQEEVLALLEVLLLFDGKLNIFYISRISSSGTTESFYAGLRTEMTRHDEAHYWV